MGAVSAGVGIGTTGGAGVAPPDAGPGAQLNLRSAFKTTVCHRWPLQNLRTGHLPSTRYGGEFNHTALQGEKGGFLVRTRSF